MNVTLQTIVSELEATATAVSSNGEQRPVSIAYGNFGMAGIDRDELASRATDLASRINDAAPDEISSDLDAKLTSFSQRLQFLRTATVPHIFNGNANTAIPAYLLTLDNLERALRPLLSVGDVEKRALTKEISDLRSNVRSLKARTNTVAPTIGELEGMAKSIVAAHDAAVRLPTDLQELEESQHKIDQIATSVSASNDTMRRLVEAAQSRTDHISKRADDADKIIEKCETALRASTAVGLAGAFHDRAESLRKSLRPWVAGLVCALLFGAVVGGFQLHRLAESIQASTAPTIVWTRLAVSLLSVGAPIWFAWLSTKQIGQRFRLAEDYAYKASISKAYEGYRREAVDLDEDFQKRLFASALTRLDEQPLRFVESETHGSPWHELLSSDVVKDAIRIAPELVGQWKQKAVETVAATKKRARTAPKSANDASVAAEQIGQE